MDRFAAAKQVIVPIAGGLLGNGLVNPAGLTIDAAPEKFKTTLTALAIMGGAVVTKAAATAIVFSAAHPVTASKFGVILVQMDASGTVTTKITGATQTTAMAYNSAALALAALPAPDANKIPLGYIAIAAKAALWTANTDDMTNGSDLTTATFVDSAAASFGGSAALADVEAFEFTPGFRFNLLKVEAYCRSAYGAVSAKVRIVGANDALIAPVTFVSGVPTNAPLVVRPLYRGGSAIETIRVLITRATTAGLEGGYLILTLESI